jgi:acyl phosphate:glycerol-3-phosphate acyltransferase
MFLFVVTAVISYLLGSIPFGYLLVRLFRGQDIRLSGSGNIGATNVARSYRGLGLLTLLLDAGKGLLAVSLATALVSRRELDSGARVYTFMCLAALFAVLGHIFPVWLRFRGGKGVATAVGSFVLLAPEAVLTALIIFLFVVLSSRYISLGSVVASAFFPLLCWLLYRTRFTPGTLVMMSLASLLVILRHHQNLGRLVAGTEPRFQLRRG